MLKTDNITRDGNFQPSIEDANKITNLNQLNQTQQQKLLEGLYQKYLQTKKGQVKKTSLE